jgi:hypothetical protein
MKKFTHQRTKKFLLLKEHIRTLTVADLKAAAGGEATSNSHEGIMAGTNTDLVPSSCA